LIKSRCGCITTVSRGSCCGDNAKFSTAQKKCASFSVRAKTKTFTGCRYARRFTNLSEWRRTAALTGKYDTLKVYLRLVFIETKLEVMIS
jgi:hypothetical protein